MRSDLEDWQERLSPLLAAEGAELLEVHASRGRTAWRFRFFVDRERGTGIDDLARMSRGIALLLDADPDLRDRYELEVSSPGMNRVVRTEAHFRRFVGERVHVRTFEARDGRRSFDGKIDGCDDGIVSVTVDGLGSVGFGLDEIERAELRLDPRRPPRRVGAEGSGHSD